MMLLNAPQTADVAAAAQRGESGNSISPRTTR